MARARVLCMCACVLLCFCCFFLPPYLAHVDDVLGVVFGEPRQLGDRHILGRQRRQDLQGTLKYIYTRGGFMIFNG
jgi:hypothetical protein